MTSNTAFAQFVKVVSGKGYFKGVEEGTPEYDERMSKLVAKFKARTEAASGGPAVEEAGAAEVSAATSRDLPAAGGASAASTAAAVAAAGSGGKSAKEQEAEEVRRLVG